MTREMKHLVLITGISNGAGWGAGRAAADMAVLDTRDSIPG